MDNLKDILGNSNKDIDNQKLMDYLSGKLSDAEQHEMERQMEESDMNSDALEGLQEVKHTVNLDLVTYDLNRKLKQQLQKKNDRKSKRKITGFNLTVIAIITILILCILGYVVIKMYNS
jgi:ABC-type bacteriocin/lantibiotic exporter with double-glycine peptidase domain